MIASNVGPAPSLPRPLLGRTALVTGASRNLGRNTAEALARAGADVVINDIDTNATVAAGNDLVFFLHDLGARASFIPANMAVTADVRRLCRESLALTGFIDIVVNNAGPFSADPYLSLREETWNLVMDVNLKAVYLTAQELGPYMRKRGWGRIISMSAGSAFVRNHGVYTLAKSAVRILTESLALELGPEVTVNAVAPGQIKESVPEADALIPGFGRTAVARTPLGRLVTRDDVANLIVELCTAKFDMMTGMTIQLDGGAEIPRY